MRAQSAKKARSNRRLSKEAFSNAPPGWRHQIVVVGVTLLLTAAAYANATRGSFVYDDEFQIVKNPLIKPGGDITKALTSDVWQFRTGAGEPRSNYWRPIFVGWLALNYRLFGMDTTGWHVLNILLHIFVTLLGYRLLLALSLPRAIAAVATWLFAAHPVHIQSVTWISGSPDLLMSLFLMASTILFVSSSGASRWGVRAAAVPLYTCALLSKETALAFLPVLFFLNLIVLSNGSITKKEAAIASLKRCVPFLAAALLFLGVRYQILHSMRQFAPGAPGFGTVLLTIPSIIIFYVRQIFLPIEFGPVYGVRYVDSSNIAVMNFFLPLVVLGILAYAARWLYKRNSFYRIALIWLFLPLIYLYTINIAVLHKLANRNAEALASLESLLPVLNVTRDPDLLSAWWYLGELYREQGRTDNAANAYQQYLQANEGNNDPQVKRLTELAAQRLQQVRR